VLEARVVVGGVTQWA